MSRSRFPHYKVAIFYKTLFSPQNFSLPFIDPGRVALNCHLSPYKGRIATLFFFTSSTSVSSHKNRDFSSILLTRGSNFKVYPYHLTPCLPLACNEEMYYNFSLSPSDVTDLAKKYDKWDGLSGGKNAGACSSLVKKQQKSILWNHSTLDVVKFNENWFLQKYTAFVILMKIPKGRLRVTLSSKKIFLVWHDALSWCYLWYECDLFLIPLSWRVTKSIAKEQTTDNFQYKKQS